MFHVILQILYFRPIKNFIILNEVVEVESLFQISHEDYNVFQVIDEVFGLTVKMYYAMCFQRVPRVGTPYRAIKKIDTYVKIGHQDYTTSLIFTYFFIHLNDQY